MKQIACALLFLILAAACARAQPTAAPSGAPTLSPTVAPAIQAQAVSGVVVDSQGQPLSGATVRQQGTPNFVLSDSAGWFLLAGLTESKEVTVSAWKEGYYCANAQAAAPATGLELVLRSVQLNDNPAYQWVPPTGENSCYSCKPAVTQVWLDNDAHAKSAGNIRFLTMYLGTDAAGRQSPPTRYGTTRDYGRVPLRPDPSQPYYGPGYKLDFPDSAGNCAACHVPGAAVDAPYDTDPSAVSGVNAFGVHCDFCHKVAAVKLDPGTRLPYPNMPGVLSMGVRRPFPDDKERYQIFFGTFDDDNVPQEDTYLPLFKESQFCAPCHFGVFWDTVVYNSFGEWLQSPYSIPATGKTCQQCHMPAPTIYNGAALTNVAPGKGGIERDPLTIPAHTFPGAASQELLQNAVTLSAAGQLQGQRLIVTVSISNDKTGHHVPTDSPLRQMLLLVEARDAEGRALTLLQGPTIPEWGGVGDPARGYYAGLPGQGYAKILSELWTEVSPTGAYWNPTTLVSDNRLAAFAADTSSYTFAAPLEGKGTIQIRLLFRRAFKALMDQKGWEVPDILMAQQMIAIDGP